MVDAIAGSGLKGDFSAILIVNNRIFTITDILDNIEKTLDKIGDREGQGKGITVQGADLSRIQSQIKTQSTQENFKTPGQQALSRNRAA